MFKKRRQRSKKYTLTSFGSVDEDKHQDSQEEDGVFPGSESEIDDEGFSAAPDPTWDSDYLDMLEKRATAGSEGREDRAEDAVSPGLSDTAGKGAQLFEQQRKRAAEHTKKAEDSQLQVYEAQGQLQPQTQSSFNVEPVQVSVMARQQKPSHVPEAHDIQKEHVSRSPPPVARKPATASVTLLTTPASPAQTSSPEIPASNVVNRTARPFTPGFIAVRAATAPVTFRPPVTKITQQPSSAAVVLPPFSAPSSMPPQSQSGPPPVIYPPSSIPTAPLVPVAGSPVSFHTPAVSTSMEKLPPMMTTTHHVQFSTPPTKMPSAPPVAQPVAPRSSVSGLADQRAPVEPPRVPAGQPPPPKSPLMFVSSVSVVPQSEAVAPTLVPGPTGRTGILFEARRRSGKPKPMFNVPDVGKKSPNPDLLNMVQKMDDRFVRQKHNQPVSDTVSDGGEETSKEDFDMGRAPPPVAPKPKVLPETPQFLQAGGKGAELFARRQTRMGMYVVDTPPETPHKQNVSSYGAAQLHNLSLSPSLPSQWKLSPNVRAPPPIGYNPLMTPSIPAGPQRGTTKPHHGSRGGSQRDGIKAIDFMRRQPYQLNPAMFNYGGSATNLSATPSYQRRQQSDYTMVGSSLASPKQIPIKTARVYEVKRFSTPTPMSAPTLAPKVIAPRSATTLGERLNHSEMVSPPLPPLTLETAPAFNNTTLSPTPPKPAGLPNLPKFSSTSVPNPVPQSVPTAYTAVSFSPGLQTAKQFQSAPELSALASLPPLKSNCIQAPKPRFVATRGGVQPHIWRPGAL